MEDIPISLEKTKSCERYMTSELFKGKKQPVLSQDDVALPTTTFLRTYFEKGKINLKKKNSVKFFFFF